LETRSPFRLQVVEAATMLVSRFHGDMSWMSGTPRLS
jgi:hypothetical protein